MRLHALAALLLSFAAAGARAHAQNCTLTRAAQLPINFDHSRLQVTITINDQPAQLIVDTGATITSLTKDAAYRLSVQRDTDHSMEIFGAGATDNHLDIGLVAHIDLDQTRLSDRAVAIMAMSNLDRQNDGLLGADILSKFEVEIDLPQRLLTLWNRGTCANPAPGWASSAQIVEAQIDARHHIQVPVRIEQSQLSLMLDTGAQSLALNTRAAAQAAGDAALQAPLGDGIAANNQHYSAWYYRFHEVKFAGQTTQDVPAQIFPRSHFDEFDGLLGITPLLQNRHFWLSYATSRVYLAP
jgi:predicted aspartyl protease